MNKHFVTFYSPGTFVAEATTRPIESWDIEAAKEMAHDITERYSATPYGFRFTTRARGVDDLDSHVAETSPMYYLGGRIETVEQVRARAKDDERILLSNMECNGWDRIVVNDNSWRWTQPLEAGDVVLDWQPRVKKAGAR